MIIIALGANLPSHLGAPPQTFSAVCSALEKGGVFVKSKSSLWKTAPVPISGQPWYHNQVISVKTQLDSQDLLQFLHALEAQFGRTRAIRNEARILDLDLIAYRETVLPGINGGVILPHPRMHERRFVLGPLQEIAPDWHHPVTGRSIEDMLSSLPNGQLAEKSAKEI